MFRAFAFLSRGLDQLARQFAPLLNRNIILYPARDERAATMAAKSLAGGFKRIAANLQFRWENLFLAATPQQRERIATLRCETLSATYHRVGAAESRHGIEAFSERELPADLVLRHLSRVTPHQVEMAIGPDLVRRTARAVRLFVRPPISWLPLVRAFVPDSGPKMRDAELLAAGVRRAAVTLKQYHDRWFWLADLHGTVTPSQFVDRLGTLLVRTTMRPARRLILFGGLFLVIDLLLRLTNATALAPVKSFLHGFVGPTVLILGSTCFAVLAFGSWLRRLAREATEFYERAAQSQFLSLTEMIRTRHLHRDADLLYRRVLQAELGLHDKQTWDDEDQRAHFLERVRLSLVGTRLHRAGPAHESLDRVVLLYRDSLDGALLGDSDTRTTSQLLGNPANRQLLTMSQRIPRREFKSLQTLDLERQKAFLGGPYLWFNLIAQAVAHSTAVLILDYNRNAIPLNELPQTTDDERERYEAWLASNTGVSISRDSRDTHGANCVTTAFTALHFLDFDPARDQEVLERFGAAVLARVKQDRALLVRRIFGTYPMHRLPRDERVLNFYAIYERWFAKGRALIIPMRVLWRGLRGLWRFVCRIGRAIREIRRPNLGIDRELAGDAEFIAAVRKIDRVRGPVVQACLRLRASFDPEYLGLPIPGTSPDAPLPTPDFETDLKFLQSDTALEEDVQRQQKRSRADLRRLQALIDDGLIDRVAVSLRANPASMKTPEHLRAMAVAYVANLNGVRSHLSSREILDEIVRIASLVHLPGNGGRFRPRLYRMFKSYCREYPIADPVTRKAAWRAIARNHWGSAEALVAWHTHGDKARSRGESLLGDLVRHPGRLTEQLVTLRTVQTLSVLDVLNYRQHVWTLGNYIELEAPQNELLEWDAPADGVSGGQFPKKHVGAGHPPADHPSRKSAPHEPHRTPISRTSEMIG